MYTFEISSEILYEIINKIASKKGVCESVPKIRVTNHEGKHKTAITLVCTHKNPNLNCGTSAEYCKNCKNKEKIYQKNKEFSDMLYSFCTALDSKLKNRR